MKLLERFEPVNPCNNGSKCLVRASCRISFWVRESKCEIYKKFITDRERFRKLNNAVDNIIFHMVFWPISIWVMGTFIAGLILQGLYIWAFIKGFFL